MARGRMLSKTWGSSRKGYELVERAGPLADFAHALYPLIVAHHDDFGRLECDAFTARQRYFPNGNHHHLGEYEQALQALHDVGLIIRYRDTQGRDLVQVVGYKRHQSGLHKRTESAYEPPPNWNDNDSGNSGKFPEESGNSDDFREESGNSRPTKPNLTKPNLTKEELKGRGTAGAATAAAAWLVAEYHKHLPDHPKVLQITAKRVAHTNARLKEHPREAWPAIFQRAARSPFLTGRVPPRHGHSTAMMATFDWFIENADNIVKLLEGRYDDQRKVQRVAPPVVVQAEPWASIAKQLQRIVNRHSFHQWFGAAHQLSFDPSTGRIVLAVPSTKHREWIESKYATELRTAVSAVAPNASVAIEVAS